MIEWTNEWWQDAEELDAKRWVLMGNSVARQFRGALQEQIGQKIKLDFYASSFHVEDNLLLKRLRHFFDDMPYQYEVALINLGFYKYSLSENFNEDIFQTKYEELIKYLRSKCKRCIILSGTHYEKEIDGIYICDEDINKVVEGKNEIAKRIAQELDIQYIDMYTFLKDKREIFPHRDHVHFERSADVAIAGLIVKELGYSGEQLKLKGETVIAAKTVAATIVENKESALLKKKALSDKHFEMFKLMNRWLINKQQGKELATYFEDNSYKKVAIYGMSFVGERLYDDLRNTDVQVIYAIDKCTDKVYADLEVCKLGDKLPKADVIVVTAITYYKKIVEELLKVTDIPVVSLEDIIYGL